MELFAKNLSIAFKNSGLSTKDLSTKTGISELDLNAFFKAEKNILPSQILTLSEALNVGVHRLLMKNEIPDSTFSCKLLVLDIDGVMTDGGMYVCSDKVEIKKFDTKDGLGIKRAIKKGLEVGIISSGKNIDLVNYRAEMLDIKRVYVGTNSKLPILQSWCDEMNIKLSDVAYIGDDLNDLEILKSVGFAACPADSVDTVKSVCTMILKKHGGKGCVRELIEYLDLI